jgi:hypothetical protein
MKLKGKKKSRKASAKIDKINGERDYCNEEHYDAETESLQGLEMQRAI